MILNPAQDKCVLKRQLTPSPGFAKTAPWWLAARTLIRLKNQDYYQRLAPPTFTTTTAGPLAFIYSALQDRFVPLDNICSRQFILTLNSSSLPGLNER